MSKGKVSKVVWAWFVRGLFYRKVEMFLNRSRDVHPVTRAGVPFHRASWSRY